MFISFLLAIFVFQPLQAQPESWHKNLSQKIDQVIRKSGIPKKNISLSVTYESFDQDKELYALNADVKRTPASLSKIFTAGAVLTEFENSHKFETQLITAANNEGTTLKGHLYLLGGGNPSFVSEDLWKLVNDFTRTNITRIEGDIVVDDSLFDTVRFDPGREPSRVDRAYDAPIGAMSFNWNSINFYVRPSAKVGSPARIYADPVSDYAEIINKTKTVKSKKRVSIKVKRLKSSQKGRDKFQVSGQIPLGYSEKVIYKSITKPDYWSGEQLKSFLKQRGISVTGRVVVGKAPKNYRVLSEVKSKPIDHIVKDMMKFSNNYVAEMLTKNLAVKVKGSPGEMKNGLDQVRRYIESTGVKKVNYSFKNASGLTRRNKFRAKDITLVLNSIKSEFKSFPEFLVSLPIAGIDGTLKSRMVENSVKAWVRAKTGMLSGTIGLAGYAKSKKKPLFTFTFIFNGANSKVYKARELADRIAFTLVNES